LLNELLNEKAGSDKLKVVTQEVINKITQQIKEEEKQSTLAAPSSSPQPLKKQSVRQEQQVEASLRRLSLNRDQVNKENETFGKS